MFGLKFFGDPCPGLRCALASLGHFRACKNFRGKCENGNSLPKKNRHGYGVQTYMSYFLDSGPKFTVLVSPNAGGIVLDHVFPILDMDIFTRSKIFAIKVEVV